MVMRMLVGVPEAIGLRRAENQILCTTKSALHISKDAIMND